MIKTKDLRRYCIYLSLYYTQDLKGGGHLEIQMRQFINENRCKDLFYPNTKQESKLRFIQIWKRDIEKFAKYSRDKEVKLKSFEEFLNG